MRPDTTANAEHLKELATAGPPDLGELMEDYEWTMRRRSTSLFNRAKQNHDSRYCRWPGQSEDGRKWTPRPGEREVRPWKGASDSDRKSVV